MHETRHMEFKSEFTDKITKSVIAFSNSDGGTIIVGADDDGKIIGLADPDTTALKCVNAIKDDIRPDATINSKVDLIQIDGKDVVEILVAEGSMKPYYLREKGLRSEGVYVRSGPSSIPVTDRQLDSMIRKERSGAYEDMDSLDQNLTFTYAEKVFADKGLLLDEGHRNILGIQRKGVYTNLGLLLSDQCPYQIKSAVFTDEHRTGFIDRSESTGSVLRQFDDVIAFIRRNVRTSSRITGIDREDSSDYPIVAVREAVLNAIVHRDYASNGLTLVSLYDDRMEIVSPGGVYGDVSEDELYRGVSFLRNPRLASVFYRLGLIEAYGTGIPRMISSYEGTGKLPELTIGNTFRVTLFKLGTVLNGNLKKGEMITRSELEKRLGVSKSKATMIINDLISEGRIVREGEGKATIYRVL